jgi:hypothetical protein
MVGIQKVSQYFTFVNMWFKKKVYNLNIAINTPEPTKKQRKKNYSQHSVLAQKTNVNQVSNTQAQSLCKILKQLKKFRIMYKRI